jgi:hypothetical protein
MAEMLKCKFSALSARAHLLDDERLRGAGGAVLAIRELAVEEVHRRAVLDRTLAKLLDGRLDGGLERGGRATGEEGVHLVRVRVPRLPERKMEGARARSECHARRTWGICRKVNEHVAATHHFH